MKAAVEIAKREILDNAATWKVPLAFGLTTLLLVAGILSLATSFEDRASAYDLIQDEYVSNGEENTPAALAHRVLARPNPLALVVGGPAESVRASFAAAPAVSNETAAARQDPVTLRFTPTDLGSVGVGVLTLLAVLASYDGIAGEKERGTLKVLLVNPLTRKDVLAGKYLGALGSVLIPLGGALVASLVVLRVVGIRFATDDYLRLLLILAFLILLISAFVLCGLAVSALTHRTPVAILALVFLWLLLVAGAGGLAAFGATSDTDARSLDDVLVEMRAIDEHYDLMAESIERQIAELERRNETQGGTLSMEDEARLARLERELVEVPALRAQDTQALLSAYFRSRELDLRKAERYAALSPAESFRSVSQALARTDYGAVRDELDEFSIYLRVLDTMRREHLAEGGSEANFHPPAYRSEPVSRGADLARAMPFIVMLLVQNAVAFAAAFVAFERYDVR